MTKRTSKSFYNFFQYIANDASHLKAFKTVTCVVYITVTESLDVSFIKKYAKK